MNMNLINFLNKKDLEVVTVQLTTLKVVQHMMERCSEYKKTFCESFISYEIATESVSSSTVINSLNIHVIEKPYTYNFKYVYIF